MGYTEEKLLKGDKAVKRKAIDAEIERVLEFLAGSEPDSEDYTAAMHNLKELYEARSKKSSKFIEFDTIVLALTNIVGILLILKHEELNVLTSKAISFIARGRL